ncbi:protein-disulfide reductase DsbD domain-containing protein [Actinomadura sp. WMMA1423]|uniref:protein-disulfide reductase DsbD domain-containing protein n=1 Tax=Actinomadura sp. WMMA1423 TaxID=2591108 RepID=UPI001146A79D|nr:protein-disulfide reductase DsbD domain-containing protein [Actinomadura sp. WMMA1423]
MKRIGLLAAVLLTGCGTAQESAAARFTEGEVDVAITASAREVEVTFRPTRPGFHIYSLDLPSGGLGIPTRVGVRAGLAATGAPRAEKPVRWLDLPLLDTRLPVYPDGPVTVSLPVRRTGRTAEVVVSYGACSRTVCLPPVIDRVAAVTFTR